jgi:hypothetical protein
MEALIRDLIQSSLAETVQTKQKRAIGRDKVYSTWLLIYLAWLERNPNDKNYERGGSGYCGRSKETLLNKRIRNVKKRSEYMPGCLIVSPALDD